MKYINFGKTGMSVPAVAVGCMRMRDIDDKNASEIIGTALEHGANFFDHADIYGSGECERKFARACGMNPTVREKMFIQSKCGIRKGFYDFSKEYIISSADSILERLNTEYLDVLVLHRPDALVEPEEVAEAFRELHAKGKVRHFGVSNHKPSQIQLLEKYLDQPIMVDQLQFSPTNAGMISSGLEVNMFSDGSIDHDGSVLDFCRLNSITIQAWSPYQYGFFSGVYLTSDKYPELNKVIDALSEKYSTTNTAIAAAWIMRHPAHIQPVTGTMKVQRLTEICEAADITLTREEWYRIYLAAGHILP